jgi:hypothetical protein
VRKIGKLARRAVWVASLVAVFLVTGWANDTTPDGANNSTDKKPPAPVTAVSPQGNSAGAEGSGGDTAKAGYPYATGKCPY